jgi:N,N'-diacetyllegionaminate synthase
MVIAEAGVNHNGNIDLACELVSAAAACGADYVKFQTFSANRLVSKGAAKAEYQLRTTNKKESQYEMLKRLQLSYEDHETILEHCKNEGVGFLSTPFDEQSAEFLVSLNIDKLKVPSGEITNIPFLEHIAGLGIPVILSTGMSDLNEVRTAVEGLEAGGCRKITLLHCISNYPADPKEANLRAMLTMKSAFGYPVGYSDHTPGIAVSLAAVALGASVIEKHLTLDRSLPGPDHSASLEPDELAQLVNGIRIIESALGNGEKVPAPSELANREVIRKSLVVTQDIAAGSIIDQNNLSIMRPGSGIAPRRMTEFLGRRVARKISAGTILAEDMVE